MPSLDQLNLKKLVPVLGLAAVLVLFLLALNESTSKRQSQRAEPDTTQQQVAGRTGNGIDRAQIESIVREYLLANPEILVDVQRELERRAEEQRAEFAKVALAQNADEVFRSPASPSLGNVDGDVTVVEFFDYNCGFCRRAIGSIGELIEQDRNVKVVFKEMPIFGEESEEAARAAIAAGKQGKYWDMHRELLEQPGRANKQKALAIAKALGLDVAKLEQDMELPEVRREITQVQQLGQKMGIQGTPHFIIGNQTIPGAPEDLLDQLKVKIAEVRQSGCNIC